MVSRLVVPSFLILALSSPLSLAQPHPAIERLDPPAVTAGGPAFLLLVRSQLGTFSQGDVILWNGSVSPTVFHGEAFLATEVSASEIDTPGTIEVSVRTTDGFTTPAFPLEVVMPRTWFVDDDAPGDAAPDDPNAGDPLEDGSPAHPFDRIQEALDLAQPQDEVIVLPGHYLEDLLVRHGGILMTGSGEGLTTVQSRAGALLSAVGPGDPRDGPPVQLALRDLWLAGGQVAYEGPLQLTLERSSLTDVDFVISAKGASSLRMDSLHMSRGSVALSLSSDTRVMPILWRSLHGPETTLSYTGVFTPRPSTPISLVDSTVSALEIQIGGETTVRVDVSNTTFTGAGIVSQMRLCQGRVTIDRCEFLEGGLRLGQGVDSDCGWSTLETSVTRSSFSVEGISYFGRANRMELILDANHFHGHGMEGLLYGYNFMDPHGATFGTLSMTNNLFQCAGDGVQATFPAPWPPPVTAEYRLRLINNTFTGCGTAAVVDSSQLTDPNVSASLLSRISSNVIVGGGTGIEILGGAAQQLTITGNDLFDNATAGYAGDIDDQTGLHGNISSDPLFGDPAAGDFRLQATSPAIDAGDPNAPVPSPDLAGTPRVLDGDGDGLPVVDMGALELDPALLPRDDDGDGHCAAGTDSALDPGLCPFGADDCDDGDGGTHPGALDLPGDSLDRDCDGRVTCDPSEAWMSRGRFVRCIARECGDLKREGAVTGRECGRLLRDASRAPGGGP